MSRPITIKVTRRAINRADKARALGWSQFDSATMCPIAQSIPRHDRRDLYVGNTRLRIGPVRWDGYDEGRESPPDYDPAWSLYWLPAKARRFIDQWENRKPVRPFTFTTLKHKPHTS